MVGKFKLAFAKTDKKQTMIDLRGISTNEWCGSGSGIRNVFYALDRDPGWKIRIWDPGYWINIPDPQHCHKLV
jgi:hypothetical protein